MGAQLSGACLAGLGLGAAQHKSHPPSVVSQSPSSATQRAAATHAVTQRTFEHAQHFQAPEQHRYNPLSSPTKSH